MLNALSFVVMGQWWMGWNEVEVDSAQYMAGRDHDSGEMEVYEHTREVKAALFVYVSFTRRSQRLARAINHSDERQYVRYLSAQVSDLHKFLVIPLFTKLSSIRQV
jgi:hypothetical protein